MNRFLIFQISLTNLILLLLSCSIKSPTIKSVEYLHQAIEINLSSAVKIDVIEISRSDTILLNLRLDQIPANNFQVDFDWSTFTDYEIKLISNYEVLRFQSKSPKIKFDQTKLSLSIPFGQQEIELKDSGLDTINLYPTNHLEALLKIDLSNTERETVSINLTATDSIFNNANQIVLSNVTGSVERSIFKTFKLSLSSKKMERIEYTIKKNQEITKGQLIIVQQSKELLSSAIKIGQIYHSSSATGEIRGNENPNTVFVDESFFSRLQSFFGRENTEFNNDNPYNYTAIHIVNTSSSPQLIIADLLIVNLSGKSVTGFRPRDQSISAYSESSKASMQIPANSNAVITVPLYVNHMDLKAGEYKKIVSLKLFGYPDIFFQETFPMYVNQSQWQRFSIYLFFVFLGLIGIILFVLFYKQYIHNFPVAILITTAIFAAIHFTFTYIVFLLDSTFFAILGPFRTFVSSFISEGISAAILISLLIVYPQRGVISLKLLISFLLSAVLTGAFYLHNIPGFGLKILVLESALILSGFYIIKHDFRRKLTTSISLALVQSIMAYFSLLENQVLFRLFYADWYIWAYILITGFLYSFIAVFLSWNLGLKLRQVIR